MQLTNTTDYAIRIVCYLAIKKRRVTTAKLASELKIPESYIPKITKQLKKEKIISASEGISGGYALAKNPEKISLFDVISCMESTMAISRCLEKDGFCSRNYTDYSWRSRRTGRKMRKMRHKNWKTYLKIACSWLLIFSDSSFFNQ